jgi:hypothetical protein
MAKKPKLAFFLGHQLMRSGPAQADQADDLLLLPGSHPQDQGGKSDAQAKTDNTEE